MSDEFSKKYQPEVREVLASYAGLRPLTPLYGLEREPDAPPLVDPSPRLLWAIQVCLDDGLVVDTPYREAGLFAPREYLVRKISEKGRLVLALWDEPDGREEATPLLALAPGGFTLAGKPHRLAGRSREMLRVLLESSHQRATAGQLRQALGIDDEAVTYPDQAVKDTAKALRVALRKAAGLGKDHDPLPHISQGKDLAYQLELPPKPNLSE